jgi:hypothetical protein
MSQRPAMLGTNDQDRSPGRKEDRLSPRRIAEPLHPEKAAMVLVGAAMDIDAVAHRTALRLEELEAGSAYPRMTRATAKAVASLVEVAKRLRADGLLGPVEGWPES